MTLDLSLAVTVVKEWAGQQPDIHTVAFFGSRVKRTHRDDSDLDVAIRANWTSMVSNCDRWTAELEKLLNFRPVRLVPLEDEVERYVRASGIVVYERPPEDFDIHTFDENDPLWRT